MLMVTRHWRLLRYYYFRHYADMSLILRAIIYYADTDIVDSDATLIIMAPLHYCRRHYAAEFYACAITYQRHCHYRRYAAALRRLARRRHVAVATPASLFCHYYATMKILLR